MFLNNSSRSVVSIGQSGPDPGNPLELESRSRNVLYGFGKFVLRSSRLLDWDGLFPLAADENIDFWPINIDLDVKWLWKKMKWRRPESLLLSRFGSQAVGCKNWDGTFTVTTILDSKWLCTTFVTSSPPPLAAWLMGKKVLMSTFFVSRSLSTILSIYRRSDCVKKRWWEGKYRERTRKWGPFHRTRRFAEVRSVTRLTQKEPEWPWYGLFRAGQRPRGNGIFRTPVVVAPLTWDVHSFLIRSKVIRNSHRRETHHWNK